MAILSRIFQESGSMLGFPAQKQEKKRRIRKNVKSQPNQFSILIFLFQVHTSEEMILQASFWHKFIHKEEVLIFPTVTQ